MILSFQCNASHSTECPDSSQIEDAFQSILDDLASTLNLSHDLHSEISAFTVNDDDGVISINSSLETDGATDFEALQSYIESDAFTVNIESLVSSNMNGQTVYTVDDILALFDWIWFILKLQNR